MPHTTSAAREHSAPEIRRTRTATLLLAGLGVGASLLLSGCQIRDAICSNGYYPAAHVNGPGSYCVKDGDEPKPGFVRYPAGKVPRHVDDEWDVYWRTHHLDENGNEIPGTPSAPR
jgi:hypothetical protein